MMATLLQALVSGLAVGGAYALVALGFSITFTTTRTLNFGHGEFVSVGAFVGVGPCSCWPASRPPRPPSRAGPDRLAVSAAVAAALAMGLLGVLLYVFGVRPSPRGRAWPGS